MMVDMDAFIRGMPKAELHVHVEGTLEPELRVRLAERNGVELPYRTADELAASYAYQDLSSFLALYFSGMDVLQTEQDFFELTYEYLRRVHAQNVVYTEMHFDPQAHTSRGIAFDTVISGIRRAQEMAQDELGIRSHLILGILRDMSAESAMEALEQSLAYRDRIVGVGLDSDEKGNPPVKFRDVFERARAEGYKLTMHCDHLQENSVEHIRQCLDVMGVDRIDHGYHVLDDEGLIEDVRRRQVCLTFCTTSNPSDPAPRRAAELKRALELGLNVTVNTDDPAYMRSYYLSEVLLNTQQAVDSGGREGGVCRGGGWVCGRATLISVLSGVISQFSGFDHIFDVGFGGVLQRFHCFALSISPSGASGQFVNPAAPSAIFILFHLGLVGIH